MKNASEALRDGRYLRFAIPGLVLVLLSIALWGDGWWDNGLLFVGLALIVVPYPRKPEGLTRGGR